MKVASPPIERGREFENVMLRVPFKLKEKLKEIAGDENVSQNTLMTASLLLSTFAWGKLPIVGPPDNVLMLLDEINRAVDAEDIAFGAFHSADWADVKTFVDTFQDYGFIQDFQARTDSAASDTIAYRFYLTKAGASVLPMVTWFIRMLIESRKDSSVQENQPSIRNQTSGHVA